MRSRRGWTRAGRAAIACGALALSLGVAAPAGASTTVGQLPGTADAGSCAGRPNTVSFVQTGVAAGNSYTVPSAGVLTSWTTKPPAPGATTKMALKVFRPTGVSNQFLVVGLGDIKTIFGSKAPTRTFGVRIPVRAGDELGVQGVSGACEVRTGVATDTIAFSPTGQDAPLGSTNTFNPGSMNKLQITAALEPDLDNDGFGDETQDHCLNMAGPNDGCPNGTQGTAPGSPTVTGTNPAVGITRVGKSLTLKGRSALVKLHCTLQTSCKGSLSLTTTGLPKVHKASAAKAKATKLGKAKFTIAAGKTKTVKVKLGRSIRKRLGKLSARRLKKLKIGAAAKVGTQTTKFTLHAVRKH
jgi:CxxC motif-containing protein